LIQLIENKSRARENALDWLIRKDAYSFAQRAL